MSRQPVSNTVCTGGTESYRLTAISQARYWILTIPHNDWQVPGDLPDGISWLKGQAERGASGYEHWQLMASFTKPTRLAAVKRVFGTTSHAEPTRSAAADDYVWKDDTSIPNTRFELGSKAIRRASQTDWERVRELAQNGDFGSIPADVAIRYYGNLRRLHADAVRPTGMERSVSVFWGDTGTGKSRRAWEEAGNDAYPKDPRTKFWDGYRGQDHIVIDEFRGGIDICHLLRWLDRYPVCVEVKGSATVFRARKIWITSNIGPDDWYPGLDTETMKALKRRLTEVIHFIAPF